MRCHAAVLVLLLAFTTARADGSVLWYEEEGGMSMLGTSLAPTGDIDGDGYPDLLVLEPACGSLHGCLHLYLSDGAGSLQNSPSWTDAPTIETGKAHTEFGAADFNGDGRPDIWSYTWDFIEAGPCPGPDCSCLHATQGRVEVWFTSSAGLPGSTPWIYDGVPSGGQPGELHSVAAGDLDGDGVAELVIGEPDWCPIELNPCVPFDGCEQRGRVLVFSGGPGFPAAPHEIVGPPGDSLGGLEHEFGFDVAIGGDVDGSGSSDLLVTIPRLGDPSDPTGSQHGAVLVLSGSPPWDIKHVLRGESGEHLGHHGLSAGFDTNGDGLAEFYAGGSGYRWSYFTGASGGPQRQWIRPERCYSDFWMGPRAAGDVNGDGFDDVLVGWTPDWFTTPCMPSVSFGGPTAHAGCPSPIPLTPWACAEPDYYPVFSAAGIGDLDGDTKSDIVIGAPWRPSPPEDPPVGCESSVWVEGAAPPPVICVESDCADMADNDEDGDVDCADSDCATDPACFESLCCNGLDDDGDGLIDLADPDCLGTWVEVNCTDGVDDDCDELYDCDDEDCSFDAACPIDEQSPSQNSQEDCVDNTHNPFSQVEEPPSDPFGYPEGCDTFPANDGTQATKGAEEAILPHSGQEVLVHSDLAVRGPDAVSSVKIQRKHVSRVIDEHSPFGPGWHFNLKQYIEQDANGDLVVRAMGRKDIFRKIETAGAERIWEGRRGSGRVERITWTLATGLRLRARGATQAWYNAQGHPDTGDMKGLLSKIQSPNGVNEVRIEYEPHGSGTFFEQQPSKIFDAFGRETVFNYDSLECVDCVSTIVDPDGRTVEYIYDTDENLLQMRSPLVETPGGSGMEQRVTGYAYVGSTGVPELDDDETLKHALSTVTFPREAGDAVPRPRLAWQYATDPAGAEPLGWVLRHAVGDPSAPGAAEGGEYVYSYDTSLSGTGVNGARVETTVTDRTALYSATMKLNRKGQLLEEAIPRGSGVGEFLRKFVYNDDGDVVESTRPSTRKSVHVHPPTTRPRLSHLNRDRLTSHKGVGSSGPDVIERPIVYEPIFNKPFKVTDPREPDESVPVGTYTTTLRYDYMENLTLAASTFYAELGLESAEDLADLFGELGIADLSGDVNGDGISTQQAGNVIKIEHPRVEYNPLISIDDQDAVELFAYDERGRLTRTVDAEQNVTLYEYHADPPPSGPDEYGGYLESITRDAESAPGRNSGDDPLLVQQTVSFEYGPQLGTLFPGNRRGLPTAVVDPRGVKTLFKRNALGEIVEIRRAADVTAAEPSLTAFGYVETREYDRNGNLTRREIEDSSPLSGGGGAPIVFTYEYDLLDQLIETVADADGLAIKTTYEYDANQNLIRRESAVPPGGVGPPPSRRVGPLVETWEWDERDLPKKHTRALADTAQAVYEFQVDDNGNMVKVIDADGGDEWNLEYDGHDRLVALVNREGERVEMDLDAASNVIERRHWGPSSRDPDGVDPDPPHSLLAQFSWDYDERGRVQGRVVEHFHPAGRALDLGIDEALSTTIRLDRLGRTKSVTDPYGDSSSFHWDGLSRLLTAIDPMDNERKSTYDDAGHLTGIELIEKASVAGLLAGDESFPFTRTYDSLGRLQTSTEPNSATTEFLYDSRSNIVRRTDALGNRLEFAYDGLSRLTRTKRYLSADGLGASATNTDPLQGGGDGIITLEQTWDDLGRVQTRTDDNGNVTTSTYDLLGRLLETEYGDGTTRAWTYNDDGELLTHVRQDGSVETWQHDAEGRRTSVSIVTTLPGTTSRSWTHDGLGRVIHATDDNGAPALKAVTTEFWYDSLSRLVQERQTVGARLALDVTTNWPDLSRPRLIDTVYPDGRVVGRKHDANNRIHEILEGPADDPASSVFATYDYVGASRLLRLAYANGLTLDKRDPGTLSTINGPQAGYDLGGRTVHHAWREPAGTEVAGWQSTWNGLSGVGTSRRLTEERTHLFDGSGAEPPHLDTYGYDSAYRQVAHTRNTNVLSARVLDGANKMTTFWDEGLWRGPVVDQHANPAENGMNQYSAMDGLPWSFADNGGLTSDSILAHEFDASNRLVKTTESLTGTVLLEHVYAADGRRVLTTSGTGDVRFLYSGWQVVEERDAADTVLRQYVTGRGMDDHVQMTDVAAGQSYYYHSNDQGFVGALSSAAGLPVEFYEYSWLGRPAVYDVSQPGVVTSKSAVGNPYLFQGRRWETEVQLYDFRHRWYSPKSGEFLSLDPSGVWRHGVGSGYEAFAGDPWNWADPKGLETTVIIGETATSYSPDGHPMFPGSVYLGMSLEDVEACDDCPPDYVLQMGVTAQNKAARRAREAMTPDDSHYGTDLDTPPGTFELSDVMWPTGTHRTKWLSFNSPGQAPGIVLGPGGARITMGMHWGYPERAQGCITVPEMARLRADFSPPGWVVVPDIHSPTPPPPSAPAPSDPTWWGARPMP